MRTPAPRNTGMGSIYRVAAGGIAALAIAAAATAPAQAEFDRSGAWTEAWVGTWGAGPVPDGQSFSNQTIRQVVRISVGGARFRIRLSNEYGTQAVAIGDAHVAISAGTGAITPGSDRTLTFSGSPTTTVPQGAAVLSDPVDLPAPDLASLAVSIYLPQATGAASWHPNADQTAYIVAGDAAGATDLTAGATKINSRFFLSGVDAESIEPKSTVVTFGDSITDGDHSTANADHRWPDFLADRLAAHGKERVGVVNKGESGDRLLQDRGIQGQNALARFDHDVVATPGVRFLTVLLGINDILTQDNLTQAGVAADIIAAHRQLIARAHSRGILAFGCTLTPFSHTGALEDQREAVNTWIRTSGEYDAVIDFDAVVQDPTNPLQLLPAYDSGDHLHPNDIGYQAMAGSVDLRLFQVGDDQGFRLGAGER